MSDAITASMHDARDAEDRRLLADGELQRLLESYYGVIVTRCRAKVPWPDADDVAGAVAVRLWSELKRGKRYEVPFRVVVHNVIGWTVAAYWATRREPAAELHDGHGESPDDFAEKVAARDAVSRLIEQLPEKDATIARMRWLEGREIQEIADELGMTRNAVDQRLHTGVRKLRELIA
jgi:RNA polymerase sigma factor (sigma-70 family)